MSNPVIRPSRPVVAAKPLDPRIPEPSGIPEAARPETMGPPIVRTFTTVYREPDPEAGEEDFEELGSTEDTYECRPGGDFDIENGTAVDIAVVFLTRLVYCTFPSGSQFQAGRTWYTAETYQHPYRAEREEVSAHLEGFTPEQEREIYDRIIKS